MKQVKKDIDTSKYTTLQEKWQKDYNDFPMGFAFSADQLAEQKQKLGVKSNDEIVGIGIGGGFIRKTDVKAFNEMTKRVAEERKKARDDDEFLYQMFVYEMGNCEYQLSYDTEYVLEVGCAMTLDDLKDERVMSIWKRAKKDFIEMCDAHGWY